jgi:hypothetical protein
MKTILNIAFAAATILTLVSCKKDKENPTIVIAEPANHSDHLWGTEVHIEATFEDDQNLKSYHIHIGNEAGAHMSEFEVEFEGDITGKTYDFHEHFMVPDSIESVYYLHLEVTDAEGKSSEEKLMLHFME